MDDGKCANFVGKFQSGFFFGGVKLEILISSTLRVFFQMLWIADIELEES